MHEASLHEQTCFLTLTYDDAHLPMYGNLNYRDFQLFMKRLRKSCGYPVRFYMCGEYGERKRRPHYHACLFGHSFLDMVYDSKSSSGFELFSSSSLSRLWPLGRSTIGHLTYESAAYVARYVMKKVTGPAAGEHYAHVDEDGVVHDLVPDFNSMSLRPGIGTDWLRLYYPEVVANGSIVMNGRPHPIPKFYADRLKGLAAFDGLLAERAKFASALPYDDSVARLAVKETVANAKLASKVRSLE
jgi:hypothetical protein